MAEAQPESAFELLVCVETHRKQNVGTIMRCAVAFGAKFLIIVGHPKYSTHGAHEAKKCLQVIHFYYWHECIAFVKARACTVIAVSPFLLQQAIGENDQSHSNSSNNGGSSGTICSGSSSSSNGSSSDTSSGAISSGSRSGSSSNSSVPVQSVLFRSYSVAFVIGEKQGLTAEQQIISDLVVHVSFPRQELEDFIPYDNKIAVAFQCFASNTQGFAERRREGEKYCVDKTVLEKRVRKAVSVINHKASPVDSEDCIASLFVEDDCT